MTVETITLGSFPDALNEALPAFNDPKVEGDDHIRNLKIVTKNFYDAWVLADVETRLTTLEGYTTSSDADTLDGQHGAYYQNASNLNAGTVPVARLSGSYAIDISGTAANATTAVNATNATLADTALQADNASALGGVPSATVLNGLAGWTTVDKTNNSIQNHTGTGWKTLLTAGITINSGDHIFAQPIVGVSDINGTNVAGNFDIIFEFRLRINGVVFAAWCTPPFNIASAASKAANEGTVSFGSTGLPGNQEFIYADYGAYGSYVRQCLIPVGSYQNKLVPTGACTLYLDMRVHESVTPFPPVDCYNGFQVNRATLLITGKVAP